MENFVKTFEYFYIESININIPNLVNKLTDDIINIQYDKTRFSESKKKLKEAYDTYVDGLQEILNSFSEDISGTFNSFKDEWSISLNVPKNSNSFRELISDDVELLFDDKGSKGIVDKGSGLQRLTTILLNFEIIKRIKQDKNFIVCLDEPDVYLHEGLQKKLKEFLNVQSEKAQIFYTTHSKIFINQYNMKNVFLLSKENDIQWSERKKQKMNVAKTYLIDIYKEKGYSEICDHLGIEKSNYEILHNNNLLVEGNCDKKYITELCNFFNIPIKNIISLNGISNAEKFLEFYNSYYYNNGTIEKPIVKLILDNDYAGREIYKKITSKLNKYNYIKVQCYLLNNCRGDSNLSTEKNSTNNEIEDFIYPQLLCFLINKLLEKQNLNKLDSKYVCSCINQKSFKTNGILALCEYQKNIKNPNFEGNFTFTSSGQTSNSIKEGIAGIFNISANKEIIKLLNECDEKYPFVKNYLIELMKFD